MVELYIARNGGASDSSKIDISTATVTLDSTPLVYDGTLKTQNVTVTAGGQSLTQGTDYTVLNNTRINAGDYTLFVMGIGKYNGAMIANWSIEKATSSISVNPNSLRIFSANETATSTVTVVGDGVVSVSTSDDSVATASISGNTVTVTSVADGNATITVTLGAGANYTGGSATISVNVMVISSTLANNSPEKIQAAVQAGIASSLWSVGDKTAAISIGTVYNMSATSACAFIIGFDHNSSVEGTGIHFQFGKTTSGTDIAFCDSGYLNQKTSGGWFYMNYDSNNRGGWNNSRMRAWNCPAFLTALPSAWQNVIVSTTKYTDNTGGGSNTASYVTATTDDIFLLAEYEVFGARTNANSAEKNYQLQYDYYKNGNSKVRYKHDLSNTCYWWLRSPYATNSGYFCNVNTNGSASIDYTNRSSGFAPGFRIA